MNRLRELWRAFHKWAKGWDTSIVVAVLIWIVLRSYLIEAFRIPSASMENTLLVGDFLFVNKAIYGGELEIPGTGLRFLRVPGYAEPERGGIVVFRSVEDSTPNLNIVKRVVGAGGGPPRVARGTGGRHRKATGGPQPPPLPGAIESAPTRPAGRPQPTDSLRVHTRRRGGVGVPGATPPINRIPQAVQLVEKAAISQARPTWGLDEALVSVPGVYAANRYNFSLDQRISIRGFGARSAFAVRGIKVLVDGIPQTLPDGQGQLTNLELGAADRIEILRASASALLGNAAGGVISIWTDPTAPRTLRQEVRVLFGTFDRDLNRNWSKWQSSTAFPVGPGSGLVTVSRLDYSGQRQHSGAEFRNLNSRWHFPLANRWSLAGPPVFALAPQAHNPPSPTAPETAT